MTPRTFVLAALTLAAAPLAMPLRAADEHGNLLLASRGARVEAFSSEFGSGWEASNLTPLPEDFDETGAPVRELVWSSASQAPFPHWILFRFERPTWLTTLVFDNFLSEEPDHPGISARDVEVWAGDAPETMRRITGVRLARNARDQAFRVEPLEARYLKLVIRSNYGHPWYTELGATRAFDDGTRPGDLGGRLARDGSIDLYGICFDSGSATLRPESDELLGQIAAFLASRPGSRITIEGHTDSVGADDANLALSRSRAEAVAAALVRRGVAPTALEARGLGESRPVATNDTAVGRAANRRVTLRLASATPPSR